MKKQGEIIAELIKAAGYTQKEVAGLILVGPTHLSKHLGKQPVPAVTLRKLSVSFGLTIDQLLTPGFQPPYRQAVKLKMADVFPDLPDAEEQDLRAERDRLKKEVERLTKELERANRIVDAFTSK